MPLLLPAVIGILWFLIAVHRPTLGFDALSVRGSFVVAFLAFEALVVLVTESTSLGHHFATVEVATVWGVLLCVLVILSGPRLVRLVRTEVRSIEIVARVWARARNITLEGAVALAAIIAEFAVLVVIGWTYRPSNGDSLVYHLPRVVHWIQNRSVAHFATHYLAQIELAPLHEFNLAHLHLLSGDDRLDGYVQLVAAIVCVVGVSELARVLGASRRAQIMAALLCATIPTGILEATSTQNNYFAAAIGVGILMILLTWTPGPRWAVRALALGVSSGLAVLAKGTLPALIAPAVVLLGALAVRRELRASGAAVALRRVLVICVLAGAGALAVAGPFFWRNIQLFGSPVGPVSNSTTNAEQSVRAGLANVIRSTAGDFRIGDGQGGFETDVSRLALGSLHRAYDLLGVTPKDPRYLLGTDFEAFKIQNYSLYTRLEDFGANPWHVILLTLAGVALAVWTVRGARALRKATVLAIGLACGFVLFTATARWSVFVVRYQLPLLVAWCALIALVLDRVYRIVGRVILLALVVAALPQLLDNAQRPLLHQHTSSGLSAYFADFQTSPGAPATMARIDAFEAVTRTIASSSCRRVGLANWVLVEYPLWAGLRHDHWSGTIEDVAVVNKSHTLEKADFLPCALVRQVEANYVAPDDGRIELQFANLALSIDPARIASTQTTMTGFSSGAHGVYVLPGGGWSLGTASGPTLVSSGSLYLESESPRHVTLQLFGESQSTATPRVLVAGLPPLEVTNTGGVIAVDLQIPSGVTRLQITPGATATRAGTPLVPASVRVSDA